MAQPDFWQDSKKANEKIEDILKISGSVQMGIYPHPEEITVKITVTEKSRKKADTVIKKIENKHNIKINKKTMVNKIIVREIIRDFGLSDELVDRKKTAAQYGCKSDRIFEKLSKKEGMKKQEYLNYLNNKN